MGNNEMVLRIDRTLHVVTDHSATSTTRGHRTRIGIGQGYLLVLGLHHQSVQTVQALYLLAQGRYLLVEPGDLGFRYRFPVTVGTVELREIEGNALATLLKTALYLGLSDVPLSRVPDLDLAAVYRNASSAKQFKTAAQHPEL